MDTAKRMVELAGELYGSSGLYHLAYAQQTALAQLVAAEIQAKSTLQLSQSLEKLTFISGTKLNA